MGMNNMINSAAAGSRVNADVPLSPSIKRDNIWVSVYGC